MGYTQHIDVSVVNQYGTQTYDDLFARRMPLGHVQLFKIQPNLATFLGRIDKNYEECCNCGLFDAPSKQNPNCADHIIMSLTQQRKPAQQRMSNNGRNLQLGFLACFNSNSELLTMSRTIQRVRYMNAMHWVCYYESKCEDNFKTHYCTIKIIMWDTQGLIPLLQTYRLT